VDANFHESDERLELYALDRLSGSDITQIEEHLMICDLCRDKLEEAATFAICAREELMKGPARTGLSLSGWSGRLKGEWLSGGWIKPGMALGGALAAAFTVVVALHEGRPRLAPVAALELTAMRGDDVKSVAAGEELDLTFDDAPSGNGTLKVELVDRTGTSVWRGEPRAQGTAVSARIQKALPSGEYFARLYESPGHLVHEYAFRIRN
jgi:hypothetical protein